MSKLFPITKDHKRWIKNAKKKYDQDRSYWMNLIQKQNGRCKLSGARLFFDAKSGTPQKGGHGCHPLYAAVDHVNPGRTDCGFQILSYAINDLKGHLPLPLFRALSRTKEWKRFVTDWKQLSKTDQTNREAFKMLIQQGYVNKKKRS